jgi:hypothetical protein
VPLVPIGDSFSQLSSYVSCRKRTHAFHQCLTDLPAVFAAVDAPHVPYLVFFRHNDTSVSCVEAVNQLNSRPREWYIHGPTGD